MAQELDPGLVGDTALLCIATAPEDSPATLCGFAAQLLGQPGFANPCLSEQQRAGGMSRCGPGARVSRVIPAQGLGVRLDLQEELAQALPLLRTSHQWTLMLATEVGQRGAM